MIRKKRTYYFAAVVFILLGVGCTFMEQSGTPECRPEFTIPPVDPAVQYLEFMAVGDAGSGDEGQEIIADSMKEYALLNPVKFVLYLGDNFYNSGVNSVNDAKFQTHFEQIYDKTVLDIPFYVILGNHDYRGNVDAQIAYAEQSARWTMPALYYSFSQKCNEQDTVQFYALNTEPIVQGENVDEQLGWFENMLSQCASQARWNIVFGHHPIYSNGRHGDCQRMIDAVLPILERFSVDIYICGHEHDLQILAPVNGVHLHVNGAGAKVRDTLCKENSLYAASLLGFMAFRISHDEIVASVVLHEGKTDYGYVISK